MLKKLDVRMENCRFEWWRITGWGIVFLIGKFLFYIENISGTINQFHSNKGIINAQSYLVR